MSVGMINTHTHTHVFGGSIEFNLFHVKFDFLSKEFMIRHYCVNDASDKGNN